MKRSRRSESSRTDTRRSSSRSSSSSSDRWANCNGNIPNGGPRSRASNSGSLASLVLEGDELTYITRLKEILEAFPNKGPPYEPSQLCPHVFIGSQRNADDYGLLRRLGITHVLNLCANRKLSLHLNPYPRITGIFRYIAFPAEDQSDYHILTHLPEALLFLENCKRNNGRALVHCNLGINRSGSICAAYLMLDQQMPLLKVCELLKKKRSVVLTNKGFRRQLVKFARSHNLLDPVIEPRANYLARCGSVSTLPGYSEYSTDIAPGEIGTSRPLSRHPSSSSMHHQRSQSMGGGGMAPRNIYRPSAAHHQLGSFPPIEETQSAPSTPTRFHPAYCTLPRGQSRSMQVTTPVSANNKRAIGSSHYDQDYFMDTIPEDHQNNNHAPRQPRDHQNNHHTSRQPREADTADGGRSNKVFTPPSRHYLTNLPKISGKKSKNSSKEKEAVIPDEEESEWIISSTRPLRIYKRSSTDSVLYQKPSASHAYKRADTVATTDLAAGMDKMSLKDGKGGSGSGKLTEKHRSSSRTSLTSIGSGFFNKLRSRSRMSLQNF